MPFLVQETHYGNSLREKHIFIKLVQDELTVNQIKQDIYSRYEEEATHIFENYCEWNKVNGNDGADNNSSFYLNEVQKYCDIDILDEFMNEVMEEELSREDKYELAIRTILQSFLCIVRNEEIPPWNPSKKIILSHYISVD
tara:strand:- start:2424 stop:2846 length:423 start_codon:yes stop_codon:yes gene_type:complete